jgi:hypothetical protein
MSSVDLLIFILATSGLTSLIVGASIFDIPRDFLSEKVRGAGELLSCPMCSGFWVGVLMAFGFDLNPFIGGFISSLSSWAIYTFVDAASSAASYFDNTIGEE